jgi:AcrR family transcriptional regulator
MGLEVTAMSPRTRSADRERAILNAALEVFTERGFDGATMLEIATRAKVGKGTLYGLAPSKEELFLRVTIDTCQRMMSEIGPEFHSLATPREKLRRVVHGIIETLDAQAPFMWLSFELLARAHRDERLRQSVSTNYRGLYAQFFAPVISLIESAQAEGQMGECDPEAVARLLAALIDGLVFQSMFEGPRLPREAIVETFLTMLEGGLGLASPAEARVEEV